MPGAKGEATRLTVAPELHSRRSKCGSCMSATSLDACLPLVHHSLCILLSRGFGKFDSFLFSDIFYPLFFHFHCVELVAIVWSHLSGVDDRP